ncbi:hypothetical protein EV182_001355 [Spiromyces aspiralis]|uniref:Uncharacterized protein n=1 Tax=Spiromyces aspiralis TaxID=68401 RepID=A0ACC1HVK3_9FUNG|nr:hypothetical protein EV182_001355 [Spiromyces aspiralis]
MACYTVCEFITDTLVFWLPFYNVAKLGARYIYYRVLQPIVAEHEAEIDQWLEQAEAAAKQSSDALVQPPQGLVSSLEKLQHIVSRQDGAEKAPGVQLAQSPAVHKLFDIAQGFFPAVVGSSVPNPPPDTPTASASLWDRLRFKEPVIEPSDNVKNAAARIASLIASPPTTTMQQQQWSTDPLHDNQVQRALVETELELESHRMPSRLAPAPYTTPTRDLDDIDEDTVLVERSKSQSPVGCRGKAPRGGEDDEDESAPLLSTGDAEQKERTKSPGSGSSGWFWRR